LELKRLDRYEPETKLIALFPLNAYKWRGGHDVSPRATKLHAGDVVTVHMDGTEHGLVVQWKGAHYIIHSRYDMAVAPEAHQVAWLMVDNNIARGQLDTLRAKNDGLVADLLKSRERVAILEQSLDEANDEITRQRNRAQANDLVFKGEQDNLVIALDYLQKISALAREADEVFNLSDDHADADDPR
jgi:hypothetical protein